MHDDAGWIETAGPPLLFSPRVGDRVLICGDVLVEVARHAPGMPPSWRYVPAGTTGKLLGWRGEARAIIGVHGTERTGPEAAPLGSVTRGRRLVVHMSLRWLTRL